MQREEFQYLVPFSLLSCTLYYPLVAEQAMLHFVNILLRSTLFTLTYSPFFLRAPFIKLDDVASLSG